MAEELRQKYIKNPLESMTAKLVKNMIDSDLLDMHYFLTENDDLDDDEFEGGFYEKFIDTYKKSKVLFLELGVGYNTPGIIKYPF